MNSEVAATFSNVVAKLDPPMAIVTTIAKGERAGCLIGFHTQCSMDPVRYALWLSKANHTYRVALLSDVVVVHLLDHSQHGLAELFGGHTSDDVDKFEWCRWSPGPDDVAILDDCPNRFITRRVALLDEGSDHVCVVVEPIDAHTGGAFRPLRLSGCSDIDPGHRSEERPKPPTERVG